MGWGATGTQQSVSWCGAQTSSTSSHLKTASAVFAGAITSGLFDNFELLPCARSQYRVVGTGGSLF